ncbi:hypothetical protein D3C76_1418520 [compost metagenome]
MERQINYAPGCRFEQAKAQPGPDVGPSFLLAERVLRLFVRTFALNVELQFTRLNKQIWRLLLPVRPCDAVFWDEGHLITVFQVERGRQ